VKILDSGDLIVNPAYQQEGRLSLSKGKNEKIAKSSQRNSISIADQCRSIIKYI
jgi:hypothetical protein